MQRRCQLFFFGSCPHAAWGCFAHLLTLRCTPWGWCRGVPDVHLSYVVSQAAQHKAARPADADSQAAAAAAAGAPAAAGGASEALAAAEAAGGRSRGEEPTLLEARRSSSAAVAYLAPWEVDFEELQITRPLGEGAFGKVYLATLRETAVAVKLLVSGEDAAAARSTDSTLSLSSPVMQALHKVGLLRMLLPLLFVLHSVQLQWCGSAAPCAAATHPSRCALNVPARRNAACWRPCGTLTFFCSWEFHTIPLPS